MKLNGGLIPSGSVSGEGRDYEFMDTAVSRGAIYYYKLEDVDVCGTRHAARSGVRGLGRGRDCRTTGRSRYGLNPAVNDAELDSDGDGVPNWLEYRAGHRPVQPDTDGDGIADGAEKKNPGYSGGGRAASARMRVCRCSPPIAGA